MEQAVIEVEEALAGRAVEHIVRQHHLALGLDPELGAVDERDVDRGFVVGAQRLVLHQLVGAFRGLLLMAGRRAITIVHHIGDGGDARRAGGHGKRHGRDDITNLIRELPLHASLHTSNLADRQRALRMCEATP